MLIALAAMAGSVAAQAAASLESAEKAFKAGRFAEAEPLYRAAVTQDATNLVALRQLGRLALLSNRFEESERWLTRALAIESSDVAAKQLLAETAYRQDRFPQVASLLRGGREDLKARLLDSFRDLVPYQIEGSAEEAHLAFVQTDPIPVVKVRANGHEGYFIIDTGGSEVYLEPDFAKAIGAWVIGGGEKAGFAAGQTREVQKGRLESLTLDRLTVRNIPVNIVDTKFIGSDAVAKGITINGFIGTVLLYHFLPTIDYPKAELVLRRRTPENLRRFEEQARREGQTVLPFWMAGDHLMVTWASAHRGKPSLFLIDTGGAGVGLVPGPTYVREAGIELPNGGAGHDTAGARGIRFTADQISLGPLTERDLPASFGPFPAQMENGLGFMLAGIVSHEFFKHYAFTIDFAGMRCFLKRGAR